MNRLNAILLVLLIFSAWSVVTSYYVFRKCYSDLMREQRVEYELNVEYGQLMLEQSTWAAHALIEKAAQTRLGMHTPDPRLIQIVSPRREM